MGLEEVPWSMPPGMPPDLVAAWEGGASEEERAQALLRLMYLASHSSKGQAAVLGEAALRCALQSGSRELVGRILVVRELGRLAEAFGALGKALAIAQTQPGGSDLLIEAPSVRGSLRSNLGDEGGAYRDFLYVIGADFPGASPLIKLLARVNLICLLVDMEQPEAALHHSDLAREEVDRALAEEGSRFSVFYQLAVSETRVAALIARAGQLRAAQRPAASEAALAEAEALIAQTHELAGDEHNRQVHALLHTHRARCHLLRGELGAALAEAERSLGAQRLMGQPSTPETLFVLAEIHEARANWKEARAAFHRGLAEAERLQRPRLQQRALQALSVLYERQGKKERALRFVRPALELSQKTLARRDMLLTDLPDPVSAPDPELRLSWKERLHLAEQQARHDPLTGLFNRRGLETYINQLSAADELGGAAQATPLIAGLVDIDFFKAINDEFSHSVGDRVLQIVAGRLREVALGHTVARYGGEEFIVCARCSPEQAARTFEQCRAAVEGLDWSGLLGDWTVTVSIGYAAGRIDDLNAVLQEADEQLYAAKEAGRNRIFPLRAVAC